MVASAHPQQLFKNNKLGVRVAHELYAADRQRFRHIAARGLFCGFVELDGVVWSYYAKSLALQIARRIPEVTDVVDLIRVAPSEGSRVFSRIDG